MRGVAAVLATMCIIRATAEPFFWGAATSAFQVEGCSELTCGKGPSIWDTFSSIPGKIADGDSASVGDDSYHQFEQDVSALVAMGLNAYRFSVSWPRIFPNGSGTVNQAGVTYYNSLIDSLVDNGIEPCVTLYHWDLPQALEDQYSGWLDGSGTVKQYFIEFARYCFSQFGDRVKKWITFNEVCV